jgi:hypothetical protein
MSLPFCDAIDCFICLSFHVFCFASPLQMVHYSFPQFIFQTNIQGDNSALCPILHYFYHLQPPRPRLQAPGPNLYYIIYTTVILHKFYQCLFFFFLIYLPEIFGFILCIYLLSKCNANLLIHLWEIFVSFSLFIYLFYFCLFPCVNSPLHLWNSHVDFKILIVIFFKKK